MKMLNTLLALLMTVGATHAMAAKTVLLEPRAPSAQESAAIINKAFRAIDDKVAGPMRFALSQSPQSGLTEVLYAPPTWYMRPWDGKVIYRIPTPLSQVQDITVSGDYIVIAGKLNNGAASLINVFFKTGKHPMKKSILARQGPPPTANNPTILDIVIEGCNKGDNGSYGILDPKEFILYGHDKNGAFDLSLMSDEKQAISGDFVVRPNGEVEARFDSKGLMTIGKVDLTRMPDKNKCGRLVVELSSTPSLKYSKKTHPLIEDAMFIPVPVIAVLHDVRFGIKGQEIRCQMTLSRDEMVSYSEHTGVRECSSNPEG